MELNMRTLTVLMVLAATGTVIATSSVARADVESVLTQAAITTAKQTSYHTTTTNKSGEVTEGDFLKPDRLRMKGKGMEMIAVGKTTYIRRNGKWTTMPGLNLMSVENGPLNMLAAAKGKFKIDDLGMKAIDGTQLHSYRVTTKATGFVSVIFVDGAGRIARIESGGSVMRLSNFGEAVTIVAPK